MARLPQSLKRATRRGCAGATLHTQGMALAGVANCTLSASTVGTHNLLFVAHGYRNGVERAATWSQGSEPGAPWSQGSEPGTTSREIYITAKRSHPLNSSASIFLYFTAPVMGPNQIAAAVDSRRQVFWFLLRCTTASYPGRDPSQAAPYSAVENAKKAQSQHTHEEPGRVIGRQVGYRDEPCKRKNYEKEAMPPTITGRSVSPPLTGHWGCNLVFVALWKWLNYHLHVRRPTHV